MRMLRSLLRRWLTIKATTWARTQINNALNVVPNPAVGGVASLPAGAPVCASVLNGSDTKCVPWNIYQPGGVTAAQLAYLQVPSTYDDYGNGIHCTRGRHG